MKNYESVTLSVKTVTKNSDEIWKNYYTSIKELEGFEEQTDIKKRDIIRDIRDCVDKLVIAGSIAIRRDQIALYIWNQLSDKGIKYSRGHFYNEFEPEQKGKYNKSSQGNKHNHSWKIISESKHGLWENCLCGVSRIDGIEQVAKVYDEQEPKTRPISEVITPDNPQFEILSFFEQISYNNIKIIKMIKQKTSINKTRLAKQTSKKRTQVEKEERENDVEKLINKRIKIVVDSIDKIGKHEKLHKNVNGVITQQLQALKYFDDRASLKHWQKLMAIFAVSIGFDQNEIAKTIGITAKHMKLNVMEEKSGSNRLLKDLDWFNRCPNPECGIDFADYAESRISDFKNGRSLEDAEDYELEPMLLTGYQKEAYELKQQIKKLKNK